MLGSSTALGKPGLFKAENPLFYYGLGQAAGVRSHVNLIIMKIILLFILSILFFESNGQKIVYRHDSLFVNNIYVDAQTKKHTIDSLLNSKGETKTSKDEDTKNPGTGKKVVLTTYFYNDLGLFFRKYNYNKSALTFGIKLSDDTDPNKVKQNGLENIFKGDFFIDENFMNDKRKVSQLQNLKNCQVLFRYLSTSARDYLVEGEIIYGTNTITILFDETSCELTTVFINIDLKNN